MKNCEKCLKEHEGSYGSGRFCNSHCARSFATTGKRNLINASISAKLIGRPNPNKGRRTRYSNPEKRISNIKEAMLELHTRRRISDLESWKKGEIQPSETRCKNLLIMERGNCCEKCGWAEVNPFTNSIPIELEHRDGDCYNNKYENLDLLCPNHHSLTATFRGANAGKGRGRKEYKIISQWAREKRITLSGNALQ